MRWAGAHSTADTGCGRCETSVARIYDVTTKVKLNPPTRALLSSDWYFFALYPGISAGFAPGRGSSLRNCTFWKEPSNHEFRVFVDEY